MRYTSNMPRTFFFYDLETSGLNARDDRVMQFAGIRTDENFEPIGDPYNILVQLSNDTLPSPDALMVTGITPQKTLEEGYTEAEFSQLLIDEIFTPDTVVVGFNNIRFDDEFIRHTLWRNFRDPYEWAYKDGRSRWDLLDVVRMTRALRPDGIEWPVDENGKSTNRLELLTKLNGIDHFQAHDALSDVEALIAVTKLIRDKQPKLFDFLFSIRDKKAVQALVNLDDKKPFVYVSGRLDAAHEKATVSFPLTSAAHGNVLVYDLRYNPTPFVELDEKALADKIFATYEQRQNDDFVKLPVKTLQYNHAPAVAPLGVLEQDDGWQRIGLDLATIEKHKKILLQHPEFAERLRSIFERKKDFKKSPDPEAQLYDGFLNERDRVRVEAVRNADERTLADFHPDFQDERLPELLLHYKARNYPKSLSDSEQAAWETWRTKRLAAAMPAFASRLQKLSTTVDDTFVLEELQLWAESIAPSDTSSQE